MYEPSKHILTFHIAGFQYYDGALVLEDLKPGQKVVMVPEPDNPYDHAAIQLRAFNTKLGYIPSDDNGLISLLMHYGHDDVFEARILQVKPDASPWEQVRVGVYVTDARELDSDLTD